MTMTVDQLDQLVENCDADINRLDGEIASMELNLRILRSRRADAARNRDTWANHPDRPDYRPDTRGCLS